MVRDFIDAESKCFQSDKKKMLRDLHICLEIIFEK